MEFDFEDITKELCYKLLCAYVAPRPIALVTTISSEGNGNVAPMSFFNVFGDDPPIIILGLRARPDGQPKDTTKTAMLTDRWHAFMEIFIFRLRISLSCTNRPMKNGWNKKNNRTFEELACYLRLFIT